MQVSFTTEGNVACGVWRLVGNYFPGRVVAENVHFDPTPRDGADLLLAERLINSFYAMRDHELSSIEPVNRPHSGVWEMMKHEFHGTFYGLMANKDVSGFASYMNNAMRETLTHGLGPGKQTFGAVSVPGDGLNGNIIITLDRLASLAQAIGALQIEGAEQGPYGVACGMSAEELTQIIETAIGAPIGRPAVMGNFGVVVGSGIIDVRVPEDVYTIYRSKQILEDRNLQRVCEIGGGLGGNAIQALRMGLPTYTIADLPVTSIIQGWFLSSILGSDKVRMFGEPDTGQQIKLIPYWQFFDRDLSFDLVINRDSMPEIQVEHAELYVREIANRSCYLFSINQEGRGPTSTVETRQLLVKELVAKQGGLTCIARTPSWIRQGYVDELFAPYRAERV